MPMNWQQSGTNWQQYLAAGSGGRRFVELPTSRRVTGCLRGGRRSDRRGGGWRRRAAIAKEVELEGSPREARGRIGEALGHLDVHHAQQRDEAHLTDERDGAAKSGTAGAAGGVGPHGGGGGAAYGGAD